MADSEGCTHKRIRCENDIGKLRFLSTWCTVVRQMNQQEFQRMHHAPGNLCKNKIRHELHKHHN